MIKLIDLSLDKKTLSLIKKGVFEVIESNNYVLGSKLESFEKKFAKLLGVKYAIGVASGTDALRLCLRALDIGAGDSVLTVSFTSPFTAISIVEEGATPIFCDIDPDTLTLDIRDAQKKIQSNTKAIMPVHIYGNPCLMEEIVGFAKKNNLKIIEDACQAHGASLNGKKIGSFGDAAAFSFYPTKNLGAMGDAGMIVTNNKKVANLVKLLRHGGQTKRFWHVYKGINSRLDEIQAAILEVKLRNFWQNAKKRQLIADKYRKELKNLPIIFQKNQKGSNSANHLFIIRTKKRDLLRKYLLKNGIGCDVYYPYLTHLQPAFKKNKTPLKVSEVVSREILAIPIHPNLSSKEHVFVINTIRKFFSI